MSNTFDMVCKDCKEGYWFGQSKGGGSKEVYMYKPQPFMDWLVEHAGHDLIVISEYSSELYDLDYKTVSYEDFEKLNDNLRNRLDKIIVEEIEKSK